MNDTHDRHTSAPDGAERPDPRFSSQRSAFDGLRTLDINREPGWVGGVCQGVATRVGVDPLIVRAGAILLGLVAGLGVLLYLLAWVLLPDQNGRIHAEEVINGGDFRSTGVLSLALTVAAIAFLSVLIGTGFPAVIGIVGFTMVVVIVTVAFLRSPSRPDAGDPAAPGPGWSGPSTGDVTGPSTGGQTAGGGASAAADHAAHPHPAGWTTASTSDERRFAEPQVRGPGGGRPVSPPRPILPPLPRRRGTGFAGLIFASGLALIAGVLVNLFAHERGWPGNAFSLGLAAATGTLALFLIVVGLVGRRSSGVSSLVAILLPVLLVSALVPPGQPFSSSVGDRTWVPPTVASQSYQLGAGSATLDLRNLSTGPDQPDGDAPTITASVNLGNLEVLVPDDLVVEVTAQVGAGDLMRSVREYSNGWIHDEDWTSRSHRAGVTTSETWVIAPDEADPADIDLYLDLSVTLGQVHVAHIQEASR